MKREIFQQVVDEFTTDYDFNQEITASMAELLGIENQLPTEGIIPLGEMAQYIDKVTSDRIIKLSNDDRSSIYIKDEELQFIDQLIDDNVINCLLSYVGYRLHTLTVIDTGNGHSFPLVSLVAPANHHDSLFLPFLIKLAKAMGFDIQLVTADEAYHDKELMTWNHRF